MNVYGDLSNECGNQWDWERCDNYPKICNVSDSIWDSIIEYNKGKLPCIQFQELQFETAQKELPFEQIVTWLSNPDSEDELTQNQKEQAAELEKKFYTLNHPKSFLEAINNLNSEFANYLKAQENLCKAKEHEAKNWAQIIAEANYHSYYDGDKRGDMKAQTSTDQTIHPAIKTADGMRCGFCSKVIQYQGRNIHCAPVEGGLQCQYCKHINIV